MVLARKGFVHLLGLLLLVSLVGLALSISAKINLTHPQKIETFLSQSNFYSNAVTNELHDAQQSASNDSGAGRVSLSDPIVVQAVKSVFTPQLIQQYSDTVLKSNYAWLEGKTSSPQFSIDLKPDKQKLAQQVGDTVKARLAQLSPCLDAQLAQLQATLNTDPLAIPCLLPTLDAQTAAKQATAQINESSSFLNNPVITPSSLNPNSDKQDKPYYQKLSAAPKAYKWAQRLPWIFLGLIAVTKLGIFFLAPTKRRGMRRISIIVLLAGLVLAAVKLVADKAFNRLEKHLFTNSDVGQLQHSLTDFLHRVETQLVKIDLYFAIAFLAAGALTLGVLWLTRNKPVKPGKNSLLDKKPPADMFADTPAPATKERLSLPGLKHQPRSTRPKGPKPPRLIQ
jgi:hypothetical protein